MAGPAPFLLSPAEQAAIDTRMMREALSLARRGLGNTWPNPAVGAVVWHMTPEGPLVVGRGFTQPGGRPHAETVALAQAGERARGASMAVTLEPCSHHGRTPPCCEAVVTAGIARVVSALEDPDPRVNGRGHIHLRAAGIPVTVGTLAGEAREVNYGFILKVVDGRPLVTVKLAQTSDGFAAGPGPDRLMITGPAAVARVHKMRARHDAIMVGAGTVAADDPLLTVRLTGLSGRSPVRIVVDPDLRTPPAARVVGGSAAGPRTWFIAAQDASFGAEQGLAAFDVPVVRVPRTPSGGIDLREALGRLARRGITRLFCEGGPRLAEALAAAGFIDTLVLFTAPEPLGRAGLEALGPALRRITQDPQRFEASPPVMVGRDEMRCFRRII